MRINKHPLSYTILVFSLLSSISLLLLSICAKTSNIYYLLPDLLGWATLLEGLIAILGISLTDSPATVPIVSAFCLRAALALINAYVTPLPYSQADAAAFETVGWVWSQNGLVESLANFKTGSDLYPWLISIVYVLTNRSPLMIQGINVLFGSLIVWNVYRISKLLWNTRIAVRAAWFIALFPSLALYSAVTLREVAIVYPLTLALVYLVLWHQTKKTRYLALSLVSLGISISFHTGILAGLLILVGLFLGRFLYHLVRKKGSNFVNYTGSLLLISTFFGLIILSGWGLEKIGGSIENISLEKVATAQQVRARDRAAYLENLSISNPADLVWQTPLRLMYFLYTPFIWMIRTGADVGAQFDVVLYLGITISLYRSRRYILSNPAAFAIFLLLLALIIVFALSTSNYGTALRHRAKFAPIAMSLTVIAPWERKLTQIKR
ncbi:MAG TPA: hypothetical protein DD379_02410 [Cyanobacteria bacterium UBA11162]|nr:hypothetical protein [Cyanobacteria bacterium UBA11162]